MRKILCNKLHAIHLQSQQFNGELAQLARALAWHARGHRFESGILHHSSRFKRDFFVLSQKNYLTDIHILLFTFLYFSKP